MILAKIVVIKLNKENQVVNLKMKNLYEIPVSQIYFLISSETDDKSFINPI